MSSEDSAGGNAVSMLDHWASVANEHSCIVAFIDWLSTQGLRIAETETDMLCSERPHALVMRFLDVDAAQLERERRALVDSLHRSDDT